MKFVFVLCLSLVASGGIAGLEPVPESGDASELFKCVEYKDLDEIAPCAVPKIISVPDPCAEPCEPTYTRVCKDGKWVNECTSCECEQKMVSIQICVPESCCDAEPEITTRWNGSRIEYDYGEYEIDVRIKDGHIEVDYQD